VVAQAASKPASKGFGARKEGPLKDGCPCGSNKFYKVGCSCSWGQQQQQQQQQQQHQQHKQHHMQQHAQFSAVYSEYRIGSL
jgi:hypothetical protein